MEQFFLNVINFVEALLSTRGLKRSKINVWIKLSAIRKADLRVPFILLNSANLREESEEEMMSVIAHEIAHLILGHLDHDAKGDKEKEADNTIKNEDLKELLQTPLSKGALKHRMLVHDI